MVINVDMLDGSLCSLKIQILLCLRGVDMSRLIWVQLSSWGPPPRAPVKRGRHLSSLPAKPLVGMTKWGCYKQALMLLRTTLAMILGALK